MRDRRPGSDWDLHNLFWSVLAVGLCINVVMLLVDHQPLFIIGDSMVYVNSAFGPGGPGDRSFSYGRYLIGPLLSIFGTLNSVVVAQSVMAAACAAMMAVILSLGFAVDRWIAWLFALGYLGEPLALLYQRMMMTEGPALFFMAVFLLLAMVYLETPGIALLVGLAAANIASIAFRVSFLPVLVLSMFVLPPLALFRQWPLPRPVLTRCAVHLAVGVALTFGMQALYKQLFHSVTGQPPGFNSSDGLFLLASWAPLLTRDDFPDPSLYDRIRPTLYSDPRDRSTRPGQLFPSDGLIGRLIATQQNQQAATALAKQIAFNIARRDPLGVLMLGWQTYLDFWNPGVMANVIAVDEGQQEADAPLIDRFRTQYGEDISGHQLLQTFVKSWHAQAALWYRFILLAPFLWLAAFLLRLRCWRPMLLLGIGVMGLLLVDTMVVVEPVVRYLHSIAWLTIILCGVIAQSIMDVVRRPLSA